MPKGKKSVAAAPASAAAIARANGFLMLTTPQLADLWNMNAGTLKNWRSSGRGPRFVTIEGIVRYKVEDVAAFERAGRSK